MSTTKKVVEVEVVSTEVNPKGTNMTDSTVVNDTIAELQTQVDAGTMTTAVMDEIVDNIATEIVAPTVEVEPEIEVDKDWVPQYTVRDRFCDLAMNRGLTMAQNAKDYRKVASVIEPLIEADPLGYTPAHWLTALGNLAEKAPDRNNAFTIGRSINLIMRGFTLTLYDRLAGKGKGQGTSVDIKIKECQAKIHDAEERGKHSTADYHRNNLIALELAQGDEQEDSRAYAGTTYFDSPLPLDYEFLMDIAADYAEGAELIYSNLNMGVSNDPMLFEVWSVNKYASTPDVTPDYYGIQNFEDALSALEDNNRIREIEAEASAEKLAAIGRRSMVEMHSIAKAEKAAEIKAARAEKALQVIADAQARMLQASIDRGLGKVEYRLDAWAAKNLSDKELFVALLELVDQNEDLATSHVENFIKSYCLNRKLVMPKATEVEALA
jgi:hypothetical protein